MMSWSKHDAGTYHRTMTSLVSRRDMQGLQSQSIRNLAQSLWRKRRVAPIRSRSFILLGPYCTVDDSSLVKKSLWNTGGALSKYLAPNLQERCGELGRIHCLLYCVRVSLHKWRSRVSRSALGWWAQDLIKIIRQKSTSVVFSEHLRLCVRTDAEKLAESHTQTLMEVMVDAASRFHPLSIALQQVQCQRTQVPCNQ